MFPLELKLFLNVSIAVPSEAPSNFTAAASSSTSITVTWQLPPEDFRHGNIIGFKLFYKMNGSAESPAVKIINNTAIMPRYVTGLKKYSEYEFQVLARTSVGDGPESAVQVERTFEDGKKTGLPLLRNR